jgi:hypothetical protein
MLRTLRRMNNVSNRSRPRRRARLRIPNFDPLEDEEEDDYDRTARATSR